MRCINTSNPKPPQNKINSSILQVTILGTGTSQGVPVIGCECNVCLSDDPKDSRLRCAVHVQTDTLDVVIDVGPDFRQQMLRAGIAKLDAALITHEHNDHMIGLDDVRPFNFKQRSDIPIYAVEDVHEQLRSKFHYAFAKNPYPGAPRLKVETLNIDDPFHIKGVKIIPIPVLHGNLPVLGFRFGDFTYITDVKYIPPRSWELILGTKYLVISALHHEEHHSHLNLTEALAVIEKLQPEMAYLTHISHRMGKAADINPGLPENVQLAYDGLLINL